MYIWQKSLNILYILYSFIFYSILYRYRKVKKVLNYNFKKYLFLLKAQLFSLFPYKLYVSLLLPLYKKFVQKWVTNFLKCYF